MAFSPHARLDDGLLDVCAIPRLSRLDLIAGIKEAEDLGKSEDAEGLGKRAEVAIMLLLSSAAAQWSFAQASAWPAA